MNKKQKRTLVRIILGAMVYLSAILFLDESTFWLRFTAFAIPYFMIGGDILRKAGSNILRGQVFDENFLMAIATIGAFALGEYSEGVAVMLFYQVGELFQSVAVGRSRRSIAELMDIRPDSANVLREGVLVTVDPETVSVGETIVVKPGERIPLDGTVATGHSSVDTAALTGEAVPRAVSLGEQVLSGCVNLTGLLEIVVTKPFGQSTVSKVLELVENAASKKAEAENFITRFARIYTPCVVVAAVFLALLPPLLMGQPFAVWVERALIFLVISCPCALVISVPLSFFGGIGGASRCGVLVKGGNYLEALSKVDCVVFDKTGTLTKGSFSVTRLALAEGVDQQTLLRYAAIAEQGSNHPIAHSILKEWHLGQEALPPAQSVEELAGYGLRVISAGEEILAGNQKLMEQFNIPFFQLEESGTVVHVAASGRYLGCILISDQVKEDAAKAIAQLKRMGVTLTVMLTGDRKETGEAVGAQLGIDRVYTELLPGDKVAIVEELLSQRPAGGKLAFVGDGINDAPVLSRADIGIAMGGIGSDAAIEAADIVLMDDRPTKLVTALFLARRTLRIVKQNIVFALGVKGIVLLMGALGMANMWFAVFADVGVSVIAILNAMRALQVPNQSE